MPREIGKDNKKDFQMGKINTCFFFSSFNTLVPFINGNTVCSDYKNIRMKRRIKKYNKHDNIINNLFNMDFCIHIWYINND